ncbi:hypothetical protein AB0F52_01435 [Amycolatopsis sp. NPDC024027]|uniref:hypothetical protein n=1 Tax=Amycolatopsis sp. NPDC024027 TaxID=3154327 RepID=UPI00340ED2A6
MTVRLGPYPLCETRQSVNGSLTHVRHPQQHIEAHGQAACLDEKLAELLVQLWAARETKSCCQDEDGRAYVTPTRETRAAGEAWFAERGIPCEADERGRPWFSGYRKAQPVSVGRMMVNA